MRFSPVLRFGALSFTCFAIVLVMIAPLGNTEQASRIYSAAAIFVLVAIALSLQVALNYLERLAKRLNHD